jgi:hypothetical protein
LLWRGHAARKLKRRGFQEAGEASADYTSRVARIDVNFKAARAPDKQDFALALARFRLVAGD